MKRESVAKSIASWAANKLGCELVPFWRAERHELAKHLREVFKRFDVDMVIDVGANRGQYRDFLRMEVNYEGPIQSFEPIERLHKLLVERSAREANWDVHPNALGGADTEVDFNVMQDDQFSSVLAPKTQGLDQYAEMNSVHHKQRVQMRRLDAVAEESAALRNAKRIYLKLDTQGFDLEVFKGAGLTLARAVALQSEVSVLPLYEGMPDYKTSIATFNDAGFDVSGLFPVARDRALRIVEFDCVTVNRRLAGM